MFFLMANDIESNPGPQVNGLNVMFTNINNDGARLDDLCLYLKSNDIHIAAISETGVTLNSSDYTVLTVIVYLITVVLTQWDGE
jgi:hypothetical protein